MAIVDENGFVRFLNQSASKFFDKAVAGANFAQMLKEKFEEDNFGFNLHGMSEEKILKTKDTREDFLLQRRELPPIKGTRRSVYLLRRSKSPTGIRNKTRLKKAGTFQHIFHREDEASVIGAWVAVNMFRVQDSAVDVERNFFVLIKDQTK